jgi:hypothetical protein
MRRFLWVPVVLLILGAVSLGGYFLWDQQSRISDLDLQQVIRRDAVPFEQGSIPDEVPDGLADHRVVVLGEFHFLREHRELVAELVRELHAHGFRQYLFEWTQAADWLLADYVNDGGLLPWWTPPHDIGGEAITAIRDFNRTLPESERIEIHGIDLHLADYGGTEGWVVILGLLAEHLPDPGPVGAFLAGDHGNDESHRALLEILQARLQEDQSDLVACWGDYWYNTVGEMVEVELRSIQVRAMRESDYDESVRLREESIQWLADRRIGDNPGGTLINIGSTHAQKQGLWGTKGVEWLGDYLIHRSPVPERSAVAILVAPAFIVAVPGSGNPDFDLSASPPNELLYGISQAWPERRVFLPLDDPVFRDKRTPINIAGEIYVGPLSQHFDAVLLLPVAHRDFMGD